MNDNHYILTIGYGNRSISEFIEILSLWKIKFLVDLRSKPYSKFKPEFNKRELEKYLQENKIRYVFMGDSIGGLPDDRSCYTDDRVDYDKVKTKEFYQNGIDRLIKAYSDNLSVAIMCSEAKPENCHRSKLIGESLIEKSIIVKHIDENGEIISQDEVIRKVVGDQLELFHGQTERLTSRGRY